MLSADRGRGKSAVLGLAGERRLAESGSGLDDSGDGPFPRYSGDTFAHAERALAEMPERLAGLSYVSPDRVAQGDVLADLLLVDEAAAIPTPLLEAMLARHSRIVFATTEHGYEGTGRGFHLRFKRILDEQTPDWQELRLGGAHSLEPERSAGASDLPAPWSEC